MTTSTRVPSKPKTKDRKSLKKIRFKRTMKGRDCLRISIKVYTNYHQLLS